MKIGFNLLLWAARITPEHRPILEMLKGVGYDGVEIPLMGTSPEDCRTLARVLDNLGLERTASMAFVEPGCDPSSPLASERAAAADHMNRLLDCAQALGATRLIGPMTQTLGRFTGTGPTEDEKARVVDMLQTIAPRAQAAGVVLAIEPLNRFECHMANTLADGAALARRAGHPAVGVMFDTFHAHIEERDPHAALRAARDVLVHVHLSENDRGTPGCGQVDFPKTLRTLRGIGYDGWVVVEAFGRALPDLAAATRVWRDLFDSPEQLAGDAYRHLKPLI